MPSLIVAVAPFTIASNNNPQQLTPIREAERICYARPGPGDVSLD